MESTQLNNVRMYLDRIVSLSRLIGIAENEQSHGYNSSFDSRMFSMNHSAVAGYRRLVIAALKEALEGPEPADTAPPGEVVYFRADRVGIYLGSRRKLPDDNLRCVFEFDSPKLVAAEVLK